MPNVTNHIINRRSAVLAPVFLAASMSLLSTHAFSDSTQLGQVIERKKLIVAATPNSSTVFKSDGYMHGFGYDLSKGYANQIGVDLDVRIFTSQAAALKAVKKGDVDFALTSANSVALEQIGLAPVNLSCGDKPSLYRFGLDAEVNWSFADGSDPLAQQATSFICSPTQVGINKKLAAFYDQSLFKDTYSKTQFDKAMRDRLPAYKASFKSNAEQHKVDWQLLVAMGYQESHLKANAVSPTGVRGLMMLTSATARSMGITNRTDPNQSIKGGANYIRQMQDQFDHVPEPDRTWFALAAYNMGPGAVRSVQKKLKAQGKNPNDWMEFYDYLSDNSARNSRYNQCIHYVTRIRTYLETIKQTT